MHVTQAPAIGHKSPASSLPNDDSCVYPRPMLHMLIVRFSLSTIVSPPHRDR